MPKRKAKTISRNSSLGYLLANDIPTLSKGNESSMQSSPHIHDTGHQEAAPFVETISFREGPLFLPEGVEEQPSHVLLELGNADYFTYQNETKVQVLVAACLKDSLRSLDLYDDFGVESEYSIFSVRPDIVVVSHGAKGIVLVIEIKKPGPAVFQSHEVSGQVFDYLVGSLLSGVATPFAVLSCYDEMCLAHLNDDGASPSILIKNAAYLSKDLEPEIFTAFGINGDDKPPSSPSSAHRSDSEKPSPQSELNRVFGGNPDPVEDDGDHDEGGDSDDDDDDWDRELIYTQTIQSQDAMKALVLAIRCGLESVAKSEPRHVPMHGQSVSGSCAKANATGLVWVNMPENIPFNYTQFPGPTTDVMYLWRDLGRGSKGRVFLACNTAGRACAVKFFFIDHGTYHRQAGTEEERLAWRQAQMDFKKAEAEQEKEYWLQVYGDTFRNQVRVVQLNNLWCLMMPYFDQVPNDEREGCLGAVEEHLTRFKNMNLRYNVDDLRWRHIGVRHGSLHIFDLGSLEKCDKADIDIDLSMRQLRAKIDKGS